MCRLFPILYSLTIFSIGKILFASVGVYWPLHLTKITHGQCLIWRSFHTQSLRYITLSRYKIWQFLRSLSQISGFTTAHNFINAMGRWYLKDGPPGNKYILYLTSSKDGNKLNCKQTPLISGQVHQDENHFWIRGIILFLWIYIIGITATRFFLL